MIDIEKLLSESKILDGWKVCRTNVNSYQLFFVHEKLETVRSTDTENITVTVYKNHDGKKGVSSFQLYASATEDEAREKTADAVSKALLISNQDYDLPKNEAFEGVIESNYAEYEPKALAKEMAKAVFSADTLGNGSINALEIFIDKITVSVKNSCGIDKRETKYKSMIEAIPTWNEGESVELYEAINASDFDFDEIRYEIERKMREVRDRNLAKAPTTKLSCPVLLNKAELGELFDTLTEDLSYSSVYANANPYSEGDLIQKAPSGDMLSITMRGKIQGCVSSALFDSDGTALADTKVIENGKVVSYFGSHRFAQYLNKKATGDLGCIDVEKGTLTKEALSKEPYFECVFMSGLQVDVFNDYIGGEVRLAYYFDGEKKIPVTGVSISGRLSDALNSMKLAKSITVNNFYRGPKYALFNGIEIV